MRKPAAKAASSRIPKLPLSFIVMPAQLIAHDPPKPLMVGFDRVDGSF
jgi:hypothetical protein